MRAIFISSAGAGAIWSKILWHDGIGLSLYAKRLDRGKFIWPSAQAGAVSISAAQMALHVGGD